MGGEGKWISVVGLGEVGFLKDACSVDLTAHCRPGEACSPFFTDGVLVARSVTAWLAVRMTMTPDEADNATLGCAPEGGLIRRHAVSGSPPCYETLILVFLLHVFLLIISAGPQQTRTQPWE